MLLKKLLELVEKTYLKEQVESFDAVLNNIKKAQETSSNQHEFSILLKKGVESAKLLCQIKIDIDTILASLTLNLIQNKLATYEQLKLNKDIVKLIEDIKYFESLKYDSQKEEGTKLRAMLVSMTKDIRTLIVKLADITVTVTNRKDNERSKELDHLHREIKEIYAPLAARLGLSFIKSTLQDENLKYLEEPIYKKLENSLSQNALPRQIALNKTIKRLEKMLKELKIEGHVYGRLKHISSIQNKLLGRAQGSLANVLDIVAVRIIVESVEDCYAILGHVHTIYKPVENLFRDYIGKPKSNGYKSLHTTVYVENNQVVEVQIRTQEMHDFAEYGVAAHWLYKENAGKRQSGLDKKLTWIRQIIENADSLSVEEMIDELKTNDYDGEIYVQTPKGNIIELPMGSTPIDFAYSIHSAIGNKCVGAKVNGKMVPLTTILNSGEIVEIITSVTAKGPSRDWLKIVKSVGAKNKIHAYFKKEQKEDNIKRGKVILEQNAKNKNIALHKLLEERYLKEVYERYSVTSLEDMYASIGHGTLTATQILTKLLRVYEESQAGSKEIDFNINQNNHLNKQTDKQEKIIIKGLNNVLTRFAKCCTPVPGDEVVAYVSRGKGATIHRAGCKSLNQLEPERLIKAEWGETGGANYEAEINMIVKNTSGALAGITNKIAELKINIIGVNTSRIANDRSLVNMLISISKKDELADLMNKIKTISYVYEVYRS